MMSKSALHGYDTCNTHTQSTDPPVLVESLRIILHRWNPSTTYSAVPPIMCAPRKGYTRPLLTHSMLDQVALLLVETTLLLCTCNTTAVDVRLIDDAALTSLFSFIILDTTAVQARGQRVLCSSCVDNQRQYCVAVGTFKNFPDFPLAKHC